MEPGEVEFLAEKELVTITPNFSENKITLVSGEFGPFNPSMHSQVPLWLAVSLKQRQKCRIQPPDWLNVDHSLHVLVMQIHPAPRREWSWFETSAGERGMDLGRVCIVGTSVGMKLNLTLFRSDIVDVLVNKKSEEKASAVFTKMPSAHYMEVASLLLNNASDDVSRADEVRALVKDIWDLRLAKLRKSIDLMVTQQETFGKLDNLTLMEINTVRPFLTQALDHTHFLRSHAQLYATSDQISDSAPF